MSLTATIWTSFFSSLCATNDRMLPKPLPPMPIIPRLIRSPAPITREAERALTEGLIGRADKAGANAAATEEAAEARRRKSRRLEGALDVIGSMGSSLLRNSNCSTSNVTSRDILDLLKDTYQEWNKDNVPRLG